MGWILNLECIILNEEQIGVIARYKAIQFNKLKKIKKNRTIVRFFFYGAEYNYFFSRYFGAEDQG
ncbi:MAG: hypothetical protein COV32_02345 [Candidatus Yonathbacteria bacterium CG10_big_fil_rev_8_21_14_0_10_43_136]|uniref:Uncharacterized protein n=1 Tax=Candidatus Yonathbacteria bacterium CG_4_10_14_0_8_um_filter_43_17 TaxID=1975099 RepID=A0A2M7Q6A4_9BACT|nr:MAG: hypothetical protein COW60_03285 [Candidatus Yonathbacteria bacterium CG17_big_fil_post_rev_8_21_14_2_50_43_9]PIR40621.1 MAG: hypothetical protein COV32_02345 [Candidatus Yonathbacteria bacterium CG10_big_fil_rev_8_21_14_0_10_43_136]PIX57107.1 MAG: hypothetical protein COZ48_02405 [Candidatus Yonathbacteria bacterium CG_4_10_14_3_um_filter_43_12]PIY58605.1 MAG: hypothetical protein COY98_01305 [Candidatus Yonathbacteria bacterium CG_4_10_14_0_8_um_filter_43_17]PJC22379.1 MAG: hypothetic